MPCPLELSFMWYSNAIDVGKESVFFLSCPCAFVAAKQKFMDAPLTSLDLFA